MKPKLTTIQDYRLCRCNRMLRANEWYAFFVCAVCLRLPENCACTCSRLLQVLWRDAARRQAMSEKLTVAVWVAIEWRQGKIDTAFFMSWLF